MGRNIPKPTTGDDDFVDCGTGVGVVAVADSSCFHCDEMHTDYAVDPLGVVSVAVVGGDTDQTVTLYAHTVTDCVVVDAVVNDEVLLVVVYYWWWVRRMTDSASVVLVVTVTVVACCCCCCSLTDAAAAAVVVVVRM